MAQIKLTWIEQKTRSKIVEIPFCNLDEYFGEENYNCEDEYDLTDLIDDFYCWNTDDEFLYNYLNDEEREFYYDELGAEILNIGEVVKENLHLIEPPKPYNCCSQYTTNYCPECGNQLK